MIGEDLPVTRSIPTDAPILVAGATGYIGARLIPRLLQAGYRVGPCPHPGQAR